MTLGVGRIGRLHFGPLARLVCAVSLATAGFAPAAWADAPAIKVELNRLEARDGACRVWMVANNPEKESLDPMRLDVVLFGRDGVAGRRLAVDIGPLPPGRTVVRLFDVSGQPCDGIGHFLMNDVLVCGGAEAAQRNACADRLVLTSRVAGVGFEK